MPVFTTKTLIRLAFILGQTQISLSFEDNEKEFDELRHHRGELANLLNVSSVSNIRS